MTQRLKTVYCAAWIQQEAGEKSHLDAAEAWKVKKRDIKRNRFSQASEMKYSALVKMHSVPRNFMKKVWEDCENMFTPRFGFYLLDFLSRVKTPSKEEIKQYLFAASSRELAWSMTLNLNVKHLVKYDREAHWISVIFLIRLARFSAAKQRRIYGETFYNFGYVKTLKRRNDFITQIFVVRFLNCNSIRTKKFRFDLVKFVTRFELFLVWGIINDFAL